MKNTSEVGILADLFCKAWEENYRGNGNKPCDKAVHCLGQYSLYALA